MRLEDFMFLCNENNIHPAVALENEQVYKLLKADRERHSVEAQIKLNAIFQTQF